MVKPVTVKEFKKHLLYMRKKKNIKIFFDLETFQYNESKGKIKPTYYKNGIYSLAIGYFIDDILYIVLFNTFKTFFDTIFNTLNKWKTNPRFSLIAHNNNKYDNHYLRDQLLDIYDLDFTNLFLNNAIDEANIYSRKIENITDKQKKDGILLEKRIKSKNNLELVFFKENIQFQTIDNYMKTDTSIKTLGKKLYKNNLIDKKYLKTDYDYIKYNLDYDLTAEQKKNYSLNIFNNLNNEEKEYIINDIVILAYSVKYYNIIFKGFDWNNITLTKNILDSYNTNNLTSFQLLNKIGQGKNTLQINYTDYKFNNQNFYDYLKTFYNGGLNFYNYDFLGKIINVKVFGMDINSSYPYAMHGFKIPTYTREFKEYDKPVKTNIKDIENQKDTYTLYRISKLEFDDRIITKIKSKVIKQLLVKYYSKGDFININSFTIKTIENITDLKIDYLNVYSYITYDCLYFGSRKKLEEYYRVKTQGQNKYKLNMTDLYNIYETDEQNNYVYTDEEINSSKLHLNGLYGIPALRPYFNIFRHHGTQINNIKNGYKNSQRNILFSIFVTSVSLYNLLDPFSYLTHDEIDNNFLYCDTDSLYFKKEITKKFPKSLFNSFNLGKWDIQNNEIDKFYMLNHKKYAYQENGKITVKAGGIPNKSFNLDQDFESFIKNEFSDGVEIPNIKSIYNAQGTISIYESITRLEKGLPYQTYSYDTDFDKNKKELLNEIKKNLDDTEEDTLYIESNMGTFSISEIYPVIHEVEKKSNLNYMLIKEKYIKKLI